MKQSKKNNFLAYAVQRKRGLIQTKPDSYSFVNQFHSSQLQYFTKKHYQLAEIRIRQLTDQLSKQQELNKRIQQQTEGLKEKLSDIQKQKKILDKSVQLGKCFSKKPGAEGDLISRFQSDMLKIKQKIESQDSNHQSSIKKLKEAASQYKKEQSELKMKITDIKKQIAIVKARSNQIQKSKQQIQRKSRQIAKPTPKFGTIDQVEDYRRVIESQIKKQTAIGQKLELEIQTEGKAKAALLQELEFRKNNQYKNLMNKLEKFKVSVNGLQQHKAIEIWKKIFNSSASNSQFEQQQFQFLFAQYKSNLNSQISGNPLPKINSQNLPALSLKGSKSAAQLQEEIRQKKKLLAQLQEAIGVQSQQISKYNMLVSQIKQRNQQSKSRIQSSKKK